MYSQYKSSSNGGIESGVREREVAVANKRSMRGCDVVLRFLALALGFAAAVVFGVNKETEMVAVTLVASLPPVNIPATAKWNYLSAFKYFVVANAIACGYAAISLVLTLANRNGRKGITTLVIILDLVMVALLFSALGAAGAIGLMAKQGNSHVQWNKVCDLFDKFCERGAASIGLSGAAAVAFFVLVVLAIFNLHKKH
ncbi:CASP-like protein 1E2 [Salvia miltiorrhiza]|uniref:CASP-like protein 1E2 n=1 Tax=Salvia miltiorrhiza TaxID=226208 RepID=UPI0025ABC966|nr:CASP-like protein 1E2 [Salvia miltiorrhiza]